MLGILGVLGCVCNPQHQPYVLVGRWCCLRVLLEEVVVVVSCLLCV